LEFVIIVIAIVYSIWSEINKKKQEKDLDFDFSELSSIEDFLKKEKSEEQSMKKNRSGTRKSWQNSKSRNQTRQSNQINAQSSVFARAKAHDKKEQSEFKPMTGQFNHDKQPARQDVNYDKLPSQSQEGSFAKKPTLDSDGWPAVAAKKAAVDVSFDRQSLIKAFVLSEVLHRYDVNSIYERIPGVRRDEEE
jgi:hypothetical protein